MTDEKTCAVRDGAFVEPCSALSKIIDNNIPGFSRKKGVFIQRLTNIKTGEPSRTMIGIKSKVLPNGILFNCCPFCGERIDAPFLEADE